MNNDTNFKLDDSLELLRTMMVGIIIFFSLLSIVSNVSECSQKQSCFEMLEYKDNITKEMMEFCKESG